MKITFEHLQDTIKDSLPITMDEAHPLHRLMFEEIIETVLRDNPDVQCLKTLKLACYSSFITALNMLQASLRASFIKGADKVTLSYRGSSFTLHKNSPFLN
jgi:hypothetical protein